jgi:signal transduction histidine kinase
MILDESPRNAYNAGSSATSVSSSHGQMSYRPLQRVLGAASLESKLRFLFGACLLLLITGSFWWYGRQTDKQVYEANRRAGTALVDTILIQYHWETIDDTLLEAKGWDPGDLVQDLQTEEYEWRPILPENDRGACPPQDAQEQQFLDQWQRAARGEIGENEEVPAFREVSLPHQRRYLYYKPVYAKSESCVNCHLGLGKAPNPNLKNGDLMAVIQVSFSDEETVNARNWNRAILIATAIITVFLAMVFLYAIVRYVIVKPLAHLTDVSDEISRGNTEMRAEIHTGDEFEELASSFNRMLRHLVEAQRELKNVNQDLDSKVDQLAQMNMRLYEMNRIKTDFLTTVTHELRTPLNSIIGFSDLLSSVDSLDSRRKGFVVNIQRSGRTLLAMINDILDLAKIESGKMAVRLSEFHIDAVIAAQCDMARPLTERRNIDLEYHVPPRLPPMVQDQGKVEQILNNLLSNAIKFTPEGGRITISAELIDDARLKLVVADTGVGIPVEEQETIFEKFRQGTSVVPAGDAMTREHSGTGLGLSIVKELCRLLGGEITLVSELGKGSVFTVWLPWSRSEQPQIESSLAEQLGEFTRTRPVDLASAASPVSSSSAGRP